MPLHVRLFLCSLFVVAYAPPAFAVEDCSNGADDDADGAADCADPDCAVDDYDHDGWCDDVDDCVLVADPDQVDADGDGTGDACDVCPRAGNGPGTSFGDYKALSTLVAGGNKVFGTDVDGDGDRDVLWASQTEAAWLENLGGGAFDEARLITSEADGAVSFHDLDGDGDEDVLTASTGSVAWIQNRGGGRFGESTVLGPATYRGSDVFASDLDGDGDADILVASEGADSLASSTDESLPAANTGVTWMENLGRGVFAPYRILSADVELSMLTVSAADLDRDLDADVLVSTENTVGWIESRGGGAFGPYLTLQTGSQFSISEFGGAQAIDLDGDADVDVLLPWFDGVWWTEYLGKGVFGEAVALESYGYVTQALHGSDLDDDGDADIIVGRHDGVEWLENEGTFSGLQAHPLAYPIGVHSVHAADLDCDGDIDVLAATYSDVGWIANLSECAGRDSDGDGFTDADELLVRGTDPDDDGFFNDVDNCITVGNAGQIDSDADGSGDACDVCPLDPLDGCAAGFCVPSLTPEPGRSGCGCDTQAVGGASVLWSLVGVALAMRRRVARAREGA